MEPQDLLKLNEITDIITQQQRKLIKKADILVAIEVQRSKTKTLLDQHQKMAVYALVLLQVLLYLRDGIESNPTEDILKTPSDELNEQIELGAKSVYLDYINNLPPAEFMSSDDSCDFELLQKSVAGDTESCLMLSEYFEERGDLSAAKYWAQNAYESTIDGTVEYLDTLDEVSEEEEQQKSPIQVKGTVYEVDSHFVQSDLPVIQELVFKERMEYEEETLSALAPQVFNLDDGDAASITVSRSQGDNESIAVSEPKHVSFQLEPEILGPIKEEISEVSNDTTLLPVETTEPVEPTEQAKTITTDNLYQEKLKQIQETTKKLVPKLDDQLVLTGIASALAVFVIYKITALFRK